MGGGVSSALDSSPNSPTPPSYLTEDDLKDFLISYSSDHFISENVYESSILFHSLCDLSSENEGILSTEFDLLMNSSPEQECLKLFLTYCPKKSFEMFLDPFLNFCRDLKFLSKHHFTKKCALGQFSQFSIQHKFINFHIFRFKILPFISKIRQIDVQDLVLRVSRLEPDLITPGSVTALRSRSGVGEGEEDEKDYNPKKDYAALQIQKLHRYRTARLDLKNMKTLRAIVMLSSRNNSSVSDVGDTNKGEATGDSLEVRIKSIFQKYSGANHEMNLHEFLKLCHDTELIPYSNGKISNADKIDLTKREAKYIFQCAIALYFDPATNSYREGVIHGKRILYQVYREVLLAAVAEWKKMELNQILAMVSVDPSHQARRVYTREQGPQIVSLLSDSVPIFGSAERDSARDKDKEK
jgi:hypothetical protein